MRRHIGEGKGQYSLTKSLWSWAKYLSQGQDAPGFCEIFQLVTILMISFVSKNKSPRAFYSYLRKALYLVRLGTFVIHFPDSTLRDVMKTDVSP